MHSKGAGWTGTLSNSVFSRFLKDEKLIGMTTQAQDTQDDVQSANFQYYCNRCGCIQTPDVMHPKYHCVGMIGRKACNGVGKNMELMYPEVAGEDTVNEFGYGFSKVDQEDDGQLGSQTDTDNVSPLGFEKERQIIGNLKVANCVKYKDSYKKLGLGCRCLNCVIARAHRAVDQKEEQGVFYDEKDGRITKLDKQYIPPFILALGEEDQVGSQKFLDEEDVVENQQIVFKSRLIQVHIYDERDEKIEAQKIIATENAENASEEKQRLMRWVSNGGIPRDLIKKDTLHWYRYWMKRNKNTIETSFRNVSIDETPEMMSNAQVKKFTWDLKCANGDDNKIRNAVIKHVLPILSQKRQPVINNGAIPDGMVIIDNPKIAMLMGFQTTLEERRAKWK